MLSLRIVRRDHISKFKTKEGKKPSREGYWTKKNVVEREKRRDSGGGINNLDIGLRMGHQWARQMFPPPGKRQRVGLPLGSLVETWDRAEPEVGGVSRPSRPGRRLVSASSRDCFSAITFVGRDWLFPLAGRGTTQRVPGCHQGWLSLFEASRP